MKNIIKTAATLAVIAPTAMFAGNIPVDFPASFIGATASTVQVATKLDIAAVDQAVTIVAGPDEQK